MIILLKVQYFAKSASGIATLRCRTEKRKSGKIWRVNYFICSKSNVSKQKCRCKLIRADYIEDEVKKVLKTELEKIIFSKEELKEIYRQSQIEINKKINKLEEELKKYKNEFENINNILKEIYKDKVQRIITEEDFKVIYKQETEEKEKINENIKNVELKIKKFKEKIEKVDIEEIIKSVEEILNLSNQTSEMYNKLIERIEFDSEKNIYIKFKFSKYIKQKTKL